MVSSGLIVSRGVTDCVLCTRSHGVGYCSPAEYSSQCRCHCRHVKWPHCWGTSY